MLLILFLAYIFVAPGSKAGRGLKHNAEFTQSDASSARLQSRARIETPDCTHAHSSSPWWPGSKAGRGLKHYNWMRTDLTGSRAPAPKPGED